MILRVSYLYKVEMMMVRKRYFLFLHPELNTCARLFKTNDFVSERFVKTSKFSIRNTPKLFVEQI